MKRLSGSVTFCSLATSRTECEYTEMVEDPARAPQLGSLWASEGAEAKPVARVHADSLSLRFGPADDVAGAVELG